MLNYIWLALITIGFIVALSSDVKDIAANTYQNNREYTVTVDAEWEKNRNKKIPCSITVYDDNADPNRSPINPGSIQNAELILSKGNIGVLHIFVNEQTPRLWADIFKAQRNQEFLLAHITLEEGTKKGKVRFDPVQFVKLNQMTNDGIIKYAKIAVELAIGLIGIMALWLGIMKIAEESGLVAKLAGALKPITTRLFPDVPAEHPAMGAMIMNISANMLGLSNAATPFGLKAMEELNTLNKKIGTATDAMCTFLVINTSSVQLIPATVIAIRAAAGSVNPTDILGPVILATTINTTIGVIAVKLLAKLPVFRKQIEKEG